MPISTNSFFATEESTDSIALANSDASMSSCTELDEKYGLRCVSINEIKIQNASSSGDCSSSCPAMNANPAFITDKHKVNDKSQRHAPLEYWMSGTMVRYDCKRETSGPSGCASRASPTKQSCASRWISTNAGTRSRSPSCA